MAGNITFRLIKDGVATDYPAGSLTVLPPDRKDGVDDAGGTIILNGTDMGKGVPAGIVNTMHTVYTINML